MLQHDVKVRVKYLGSGRGRAVSAVENHFDHMSVNFPTFTEQYNCLLGTPDTVYEALLTAITII